ncbi:aspartate kinase [Pseudopedobacter saltans DSM 12145]|uniref:Aspartokinase n=1 Tax=Pseudopedobacter saltans (strain ATCC 51119 / DSM 12145 / JCM 21818 / CCUG 39354 / LMG 10337 / NBRC 100064 / NCIMB 13643) TaxID=762903 RepID=F0SAB2_PSESL|nr:aspartate kinase [Pseudopedobacter saltans DSM 12145]
MQVFKFGGASVKDANNIKNMADIVKNSAVKDLLIVVSAIGKTTNALEGLTNNYISGNDEMYENLESIKKYHFDIINELFAYNYPKVYDDINNTFVEIEWTIEDKPQDPYNFIYDQIVSIGELLSSKIVSHYFNYIGITNKWLDARSFIQTDNTYREAHVNWHKTNDLIDSQVPALLKNTIAITQGFIGNTSENFTTTLGREGSDYSAAIFANCLNADKLVVWKDVPGILNADPKRFPEAIKFDELSYASAIEMTYYGASIIHPKTIKPLQNKNIPLYVKPFLQPEDQGTIIKETDSTINTPSVIVKSNQQLLSISSKDYAFVSEKHLSHLFRAFAEANIHINMMQISALTFSVCMDQDAQKFEKLVEMIKQDFSFKYNLDLELFTIRNFTEETVAKYIDHSKSLLEQRSRNNAQFVVRK